MLHHRKRGIAVCENALSPKAGLPDLNRAIWIWSLNLLFLRYRSFFVAGPEPKWICLETERSPGLGFYPLPFSFSSLYFHHGRHDYHGSDFDFGHRPAGSWLVVPSVVTSAAAFSIVVLAIIAVVAVIAICHRRRRGSAAAAAGAVVLFLFAGRLVAGDGCAVFFSRLFRGCVRLI